MYSPTQLDCLALFLGENVIYLLERTTRHCLQFTAPTGRSATSVLGHFGPGYFGVRDIHFGDGGILPVGHFGDGLQVI